MSADSSDLLVESHKMSFLLNRPPSSLPQQGEGGGGALQKGVNLKSTKGFIPAVGVPPENSVGCGEERARGDERIGFH